MNGFSRQLGTRILMLTGGMFVLVGVFSTVALFRLKVDGPQYQVDSASKLRDASEAVQVANHLLMKGELLNAWTAYTRAMHLDPGCSAAWAGRGRVRLRQERYHEALRELIQALRRDSTEMERAECFLLMAEVHEKLGRFQDALKCLDVVLQIGASRSEARTKARKWKDRLKKRSPHETEKIVR